MSRSSLAVAFALALSLAACAGHDSGEPQATKPSRETQRSTENGKTHVLLFIADGLGYQQIAAFQKWTKRKPCFLDWQSVPMATWDETTRRFNRRKGYDPVKAWKSAAYLRTIATDSAAAATAMFSGHKTLRGRVNAGIRRDARLECLGDIAKRIGLGVGVVTSVPFSHATPACFLSHNVFRNNYKAIADELLFGDPLSNRQSEGEKGYGGSLGPSFPLPDVVIGSGHPDFTRSAYIARAALDRLRAQTDEQRSWTVVERVRGDHEPGKRLLHAAQAASTRRLFGLFGDKQGKLPYRKADGSGQDPENPTLTEMTRAALHLLERRPKGFALMVEGGAIDWAGHANRMDNLLGELIAFDKALQEAIHWIEDPTNGSNWDNTLLLVTGDHETGLLTARPGAVPDEALGEISKRTLALEKRCLSVQGRASWDDQNGNSRIDKGERVHWCFQTVGHSNSLIPLFIKGRGSEALSRELRKVSTKNRDPVRGAYLDNTSVFEIARSALLRSQRRMGERR